MKTKAILIPAFLSLLALSACGSNTPSEVGTINNAPTASATESSVPAEVEAQSYPNREYSSDAVRQDTLARASKTTVDPEQALGEEAVFVRTIEPIQAEAAMSMMNPIDVQYNDVIKPHFNSNVAGMKWLTLMALGATLDPASVVAEEGGIVSANFVDENGTILATVRAAQISEININPLDYQETSDGMTFRSNHMDISNTWPK